MSIYTLIDGTSRVPYDELVTGESYRLSQETPLMPEREPADPLEALVRAVELPTGSVVRITATEDQGGQPWYEVVLVGRESTMGWINSIALIGQQIDRVE